MGRRKWRRLHQWEPRGAREDLLLVWCVSLLKIGRGGGRGRTGTVHMVGKIGAVQVCCEISLTWCRSCRE